MAFFFWLSIITIFYTYIGYPLVLYVYSIFKRNNYKNPDMSFFPGVTLLISAYNEENAIEDKIINSLSLNYPADLLEVVVVSDGSNDKTNEIVNKYADKGVMLRHYEGRIGKTACLNKAVPLSKGDIVIFSDANSIYEKDAIKHLVKNFAEKNIGFVTGYTKYKLNNFKDSDQIIGSVNIYTKFEILIKNLESKIGSCVGADGAIFAIRKRLYVALEDHDINDFVIPLKIIKQGFRGIIENKAFCFENIARDRKGEFNRQARITNRTLRAIFTHRELLNPFKYSIFAFELISHKLLKFIVPFLLLLIFILNVALVLNQQADIYLLTLLFQIIFYVLALLKNIKTRFDLLSKIGFYCNAFVMVNIAVIVGWLKYVKGETYTTWNPNR